MDLTDQSSRTGILLRAVLHRAGARDQPMDFRDYSSATARSNIFFRVSTAMCGFW